MNKIEYHPLAVAEYREALRYYKERSLQAVLHFQEQYEKIEDQILSFPFAGTVDYRDYRKRFLADYPYGIIYKAKEKLIYVLAIAHHSRHPDYWKERLKEIP